MKHLLIAILSITLFNACTNTSTTVPAATAPAAPTPTPAPGGKNAGENDKEQGLVSKDYYKQFLYTVLQPCSAQPTYKYAESELLDMGIDEARKARILGLIRIFINEDGTATFYYEERFLIGAIDQYGDYNYEPGSQNVMETTWELNESNELSFKIFGLATATVFEGQPAFTLIPPANDPVLKNKINFRAIQSFDGHPTQKNTCH